MPKFKASPKLPEEVLDSLQQEGRDAYKAAVKLADNPHGNTGVYYACWRLGWLKQRDRV